MEASAQLSLRASDRYLSLGRLYLAMSQPQQALDAFAAASSAPRYDPPGIASDFAPQLAEGRARAWHALGDLGRALEYQQQALKFTPDNAQRWKDLADIYQDQGRPDLARDARRRAATLSAPSNGSQDMPH